MSNSIITISGVARSGKDSLASSIVSEIYQTHGIDTKVFKFADPLKRALKVALLEVGIDYIDPFTEDEETKKLLRPLMVEFGKYCRALNKDVFVNATLKEIEKVRDQAVAPFIPVISDLRYLNEIQRVRSWASNQFTTTIVYRAHINRVGTFPANEEEERSINELNFCDYPTSEWHFQSGDMEGIKGWAKKIASQACDGVVKPTSYNIGVPFDPNAAEYAKSNKGTEAWIKHGNHEPRIHGMDAPDLHALRYGHTHNPTPAPVEEQLKALWDETLSLDETIDKVSQKVDSISDRLATQYNADESLFRKMNELNATLERIDARLKRLEVDRA